MATVPTVRMGFKFHKEQLAATLSSYFSDDVMEGLCSAKSYSLNVYDRFHLVIGLFFKSFSIHL